MFRYQSLTLWILIYVGTQETLIHHQTNYFYYNLQFIWLLRNHLGFLYPFQLLLKSQLLPVSSLHRNSLRRYQPAELPILLDNHPLVKKLIQTITLQIITQGPIHLNSLLMPLSYMHKKWVTYWTIHFPPPNLLWKDITQQNVSSTE